MVKHVTDVEISFLSGKIMGMGFPKISAGRLDSADVLESKKDLREAFYGKTALTSFFGEVSVLDFNPNGPKY